MKRFVLALALSLVAWSAAAQPIPIQGHPQKAIYNSSAEWPFLSAQGHWLEPDMSVPTHLHTECSAPIYGTLTGQVWVSCQFQLFHMRGRLTQVWSEYGAIVLDTYGEWRQYISIPGDPKGVVVVTGQMLIDPNVRAGTNQYLPRHGWGSVPVHARAQLDNGVVMTETLRMPFFLMVDPSQPEARTDCDGCGPLLRGAAEIVSPTDPNFNGWGVSLVEFRTPVPIAPIAPGTEWNAALSFYSYGGAKELLPSSTFEQRKDMDLHHGNPGVPLPTTFTFHANAIGAGAHKTAFIWGQSSDANTPGFGPHESLTSLLVIPITVGEGTTPRLSNQEPEPEPARRRILPILPPR